MKKQTVLLTAALMSGLAFAAVGCSSSNGNPGDAGGTGGAPGDGGAMCPAAADIISDFMTGTTAGVNAVGTRIGGWYLYFEGDNAGTNPGTLTPPKSSSGIPRDVTAGMGGPCSGVGQLHQKAVGVTGYGVGIGASIVPDVGGKHGVYDASVYAGIRLWMKCAAETKHVNVKVPDGNTDFDAPSPMCLSYNDCVAHGSWDNTVGTDGQWLDVNFSMARQNPNQGGVTPIMNFDKTRLTALQIQIDANYDAAGTQSPNDFDCYIDDVHFYR